MLTLLLCLMHAAAVWSC